MITAERLDRFPHELADQFGPIAAKEYEDHRETIPDFWSRVHEPLLLRDDGVPVIAGGLYRRHAMGAEELWLLVFKEFTIRPHRYFPELKRVAREIWRTYPNLVVSCRGEVEQRFARHFGFTTETTDAFGNTVLRRN